MYPGFVVYVEVGGLIVIEIVGKTDITECGSIELLSSTLTTGFKSN